MKKILVLYLILIASPVLIAQEVVNVSNNSTISSTNNGETQVTKGVIVLENDLLILGGKDAESLTVGIGTTYPSSLASLELGDKNKGFLVNRMTQQEINIFEMSLGIAEEGMMVYSIDRGNLLVWNGVDWIPTGLGNMSLDDNLLILNDQTSVDLAKYENSDAQDLTSATLNGNMLTIAIQNGKDVSVDLSPIFEEFEARITALEERAAINMTNTQELGSTSLSAKLYQNSPNPIQNQTTIKYFVPKTAQSAQLSISNSMGATLIIKELKPNGLINQELIDVANLTIGVYYCTLIVDGQKIETNKMSVD